MAVLMKNTFSLSLLKDKKTERHLRRSVFWDNEVFNLLCSITLFCKLCFFND